MIFDNIKYMTILLVVFLAGCELQPDDFSPSAGSADFSNYVALGDSYTAGYTDGAMGARGQESSFPNIMATQLAMVGNGGFQQPTIEGGGSVSGSGTGYYSLQVVDGNLSPVPGEGDMDIFSDRLYNASEPTHNLGVPGAKSSHLLADGYANLNPFFARFASSESTSVLTDALAQNPTFVSLWIGGNDVLSYALEGGEVDEITSATHFDFYMGVIAESLFAESTKGVIANIPHIEALPYFNTIAYDALVLDQATADALNSAYAQYNAGALAFGLPKIEFVEGANALVIEDEDYAHPAKIRQITAEEKVLLPALSSIRNKEVGWGSASPIPANYILDAEEVSDISEAIDAFNITIKNISEQYDLAFVDLEALMERAISSGILLDGNIYTSTFVSGGIFSLDGIHPTARGAAIISNTFVEAINLKYGAQIPKVNINDYSTVVYP